ncbi:MAG TPA: sigma-70 family RNA polymerase sigma factor [Rhizomicrobium sp.]|nr:sigma-70 family RNA polymerase sigma factor [Rhizomicrobium sp.]
MDDKRRKFEAQALPHLDAAYNLARWLDPALADDIVQEAMLRAFRAFDGFRGDNVRPWLLAIVRNCRHDALAETRRRAQVPLASAEDGELVDSAPNPEDAASSASDRRKLDDALAALPEEFREVLILREMEDLSYREIADVIAAPIGTVMSRLSRARAMLKEMWMTNYALR